MITKFIKWLKNQVGSIYVWGAQGEFDFDNQWIKNRETSAKNAERAIALYEKRKKEGAEAISAYDCSGLIVKFLLDNSLLSTDATAAGLYGMCKELKKSQLQAGDLVFRYNGTKIHHVGVYIGDSMVIHSKGRDVGVVMEHIDLDGEGYWNRFGRYEKLFQAKATVFPCVMQYTGSTYVNLRSNPCSLVDNNILGHITSKEYVIVLRLDKQGWAEVLKSNKDNTFIRGYCISGYFKGI